MKKRLETALCLFLTLLCGCRAGKEDGFAENHSSSSAVSLTPASYVQSGTESEGEEKREEDFQRMLSALEGVRPGAAGGSLRAYSAACGALDFAERHNGGGEWLQTRLEEYLAGADELEIEALQEGWPSAARAAEEILEKGVEALADILSDAGSPNQHTLYHPQAYRETAHILNQALGDPPSAE
ncbi:MAG: hypothetical protein HFG26_06785 [Provencibacterium sp.]|nr:hypothetical protein [Provencibacterium sp.]